MLTPRLLAAIAWAMVGACSGGAGSPDVVAQDTGTTPGLDGAMDAPTPVDSGLDAVPSPDVPVVDAATEGGAPDVPRVDVVTDVPVGSTYALPADRTTVWRPGVTYNGGIPTGRTLCGTTFGPSATQAQIQRALDTCPDNSVVQLGAGTFTFDSGGGTFGLTITRSNITLRGAGAGQTVLQMASGSYGTPVYVGNWDGVPRGWTDWRALTADAAQGATSVTVDNAAGLTVGELVHLDEQFDPALVFYNARAPRGDCGSLQQFDYLGWGECRCVRDADCTAPGCTVRTTVAQAQAESRPVGQALEIASVSGHTVTFTTPLHQALRTARRARLARLVGGGGVQTVVRSVGVEALTVQHGYGGDGWANLYLAGTSHCWVRNVESTSQVQGGSIVIAGGFQNEIRDSYLHSAQDPNPGGAGYGFEIESYAADNLVENNIAWSFNKVIAMRSSGGGNVVAYNYFEDGYGAGYPTIVEVGINASHMAGSHMELFEGNQGFNFDSDSYWGTQFNVVAFRNHLTTLRRNLPGNAASLSDEQNRRAVGLTAHQRGYSFVGNVLGYPDRYLAGSAIGHDYPATFSAMPAAPSWSYEWTGPWDVAYLWQIGYDGSGYDCTDGWNSTPDVTAVSTTLRDGNYDYLTHAVHWHGVGGTGVSQTTPPAASTLPPSLYLRARPAFFGTGAWPWVDPTGANPLPGALPARTRFDARTPNVVP